MQQQMQQMMKIMPLMFGIFMFTFPSGLVLYFSFNIMFTGLQQYFIRTKFSKITLEEATV
jgi:membrane protein insertase Oxa1/YidC/SpoIIIJ